MAKLTPAVRVAAASLLLLSMVHTAFWTILAVSARANLPARFPFNYFLPLFCIIATAGLFGILVAVGLFYARSWARIAALALAALVLFFCALGILVLSTLAFGFALPAGLGTEVPAMNKSDFVRLMFVYLFVFALAIWWIFLFARKSVAVLFSGNTASNVLDLPKRPAYPRPIALLAWLMILSSALSALSWPLILGRIPAMLFMHIFSPATSKWIWALNIMLFMACGIGLLKLQRWSYTGTIALHVFWVGSLFVTQLSPLYEQYLGTCLTVLQAEETMSFVIHFKIPNWIAAIMTAIPTALLILGLFYYRPSFLKAAREAGH